MFKEKPKMIQKYPDFELPQNIELTNAFAEVQKQCLTWVK